MRCASFRSCSSVWPSPYRPETLWELACQRWRPKGHPNIQGPHRWQASAYRTPARLGMRIGKTSCSGTVNTPSPPTSANNWRNWPTHLMRCCAPCRTSNASSCSTLADTGWNVIMWQLDYPWLLLLLPLPWIGYRYLPDYRE